MKIKDIGRVVTGKTPSTKDMYNFKGTINFITPEDIAKGYIVKTTNRHISEKGYDSIKSNTLDGVSVLVGCIGSDMGNVAISKGKCASNQQINAITDITDIWNPFYIYYYLSKQKQYFRQIAGTTTTPILPKSVFEDIDIPYIRKDLQDKITNILKALDSKIEINNKINGELESMAKTIYDYWFLQFDFPDENGKPYKSSGGKMVWNEELKREIPAGWKVGTLSKFIAKDKGGDWGKEVEEGNYVKRVVCLRGADFPSITGATPLTAPTRYILEKNKSKVLESGDLIIEISGGSPTQSTGRICYINNNLLERFDTDIVTSNFCKAISLNDSNFMYWFYVQWLKIYDNNVLFKYEGKTTGIKNLLFDMFINDYKIAVPSNELIKRYNEIVYVMYEEIQKNQKQSQELASLRDFLLPLLMNGQVGFKEQ
ncbi:MAG: restriction endonuclease subunit S [Blautia sp.]|nr:restriction endonuclease subunit S [Lachnoclostridium sp.]MCM1210721.1 restriction endonuclease subunit S [Blautia sp.]